MPSIPNSPSSKAVQGRTRFWSSRIASTISAIAAPGAYQAEVPSSCTISPPPLAVRSTISWLRSSETSLRSGTPPTVAAEHERLHVADGRAGLPGDERAEACGVEDPGLAEDALLREAGDALRDVAHRVERVREDDDDAVRALGDDLLGHRADDLLVRRHEVVARHA